MSSPRAAIVVLVAMLLPSAGTADDARDKQRAQMLEQMDAMARQTKVAFRTGGGEGTLVEKPVFRYDDQPRRLIDATVWTWTYEGRPIAFQKIEALDRGSGEWQYCLASASEDGLQVQWRGGRKYQSAAQSVEFRAVSGAPAAAPNTRERRRQLRELARGFAVRIRLDPRGEDSQAMRLLTTPIFEYDDQQSKLLRGAVFGFSTNGTNPDLLLVLEARGKPDAPAWHCAPVRMTTGGVTVQRAGQTVWECDYAEPGKSAFPTWTYFQTSRQPIEGELE